MDPVNRTVPDDGFVLCYDCGGSGCSICKHTGQVESRTDGAAHRARGTQLAKDLLEGMDAPEDPARIAQHAEHDRRNAELLEVYYVRTGQQPPTARTTAEMEFGMRLEPCPRCGSREF